MKNPLLDVEFLKKLNHQTEHEVYAKIISLDFDENPQEEITGKIVGGGSVNIDGSSAVRRTCSVSMVAEDVKINDYYWGLKTKFKLFIGLRNYIDPQYEDIIWFKQGTYVITSFTTTHGISNYTINISGQDKMCLLNGTIGGNLTALTYDFGTYDSVHADGSITRDSYPLKEIIMEAVHHYAFEPYHNIIVDDLDEQALELLEYCGRDDMYLLIKDGTDSVSNIRFQEDGATYIKENGDEISLDDENFIFDTLIDKIPDPDPTTKPTKIWNDEGNLYTVAKISYGQPCGYRMTELVFNGDLIAQVDNSITSSVLDKIVQMLGDYEYFYDVDGKFHFQRKKTYINKSWNNLSGAGVEQFAAEASEYAEPVTYKFLSSELISSYSNSPNITEIKNDFAIWGNHSNNSGSDNYFHLRYAIDNKPVYYKSYNGTEYIASDKLDWRELIYQMAVDYFKYHHNNDFLAVIGENNKDYYPTGITGYEQYYTDMKEFWRDIYNPEEVNNNIDLSDKNNQQENTTYKVWRKNSNTGLYEYINDYSLSDIIELEAVKNDENYYKLIDTLSIDSIINEVLVLKNQIDLLQTKEDEAYLSIREIENNANNMVSSALFPKIQKFLESSYDSKHFDEVFNSTRGPLVSIINYLKEQLVVYGDFYLFDEDNLEETKENIFNIINKWQNENSGMAEANILASYIREQKTFISGILNTPQIRNYFRSALGEIRTSRDKQLEPFVSTYYSLVQQISEYNKEYKKSAVYNDITYQKNEFLTIYNTDGNYDEEKAKNLMKAFYSEWTQVNGKTWGKYQKYEKYDSNKTYYSTVNSGPDTDKEGFITLTKLKNNWHWAGDQLIYRLVENDTLGTADYPLTPGTEYFIIAANQDESQVEQLSIGKMQTVIDLDYIAEFDLNNPIGGVLQNHICYNYSEIYEAEYEDNIVSGSYFISTSSTEYKEILVLRKFSENENYYIYDSEADIYKLYNPYEFVIHDPKTKEVIPYEELKVYTSDFNYDINTNWTNDLNTPETLAFWFDFLDGELLQFSNKIIGNRPKSVNDDKIKSIYYRDIPSVIYKGVDDIYIKLFIDKEVFDATKNNIQYYTKDTDGKFTAAGAEYKGDLDYYKVMQPTDQLTGYRYINVAYAIEDLFKISGQWKSAFDVLEEYLYTYAYCPQSITLNSIPIYYLEPNTLIAVEDEKAGIDGKYVISRISIPLSYNGMMSITATKTVDRII